MGVAGGHEGESRRPTGIARISHIDRTLAGETALARLLGLPLDRLTYPRTGLPRDPYALRPRHLNTARGILDSAIEALDRRLGSALTRDQRHRREPIRLVHPDPEQA